MSWISVFFQASLVFLAGAVLLLKWHFERPRRKLYILLLDTSKQLCSGFILHCVNLLMAVFTIPERGSFAQEARAIRQAMFFDQCDWYFLSFICDFIYTVPLTFGLFSALDRRLGESGSLAHLQSGHYYFSDGRINFAAWTAQLVVWVLTVCSVKGSLLLFQSLQKRNLLVISHRILETTSPDPPVKSFLVFFVCPMIFNSLQIIIFDFMLKKKSTVQNKRGDPVLRRHYTHCPLSPSPSRLI